MCSRTGQCYQIIKRKKQNSLQKDRSHGSAALLLHCSISISTWHRIELQCHINALIRVLKETHSQMQGQNLEHWLGDGPYLGLFLTTGCETSAE